MSDEPQNNVLEKRVSLPKPDVDNITVLTESLPNEPVLPWHRFDSPWLNQEKGQNEADSESEAQAGTDSEKLPEEHTTHQLTLELAELEEKAAESGENSAESSENSDESSENSDSPLESNSEPVGEDLVETEESL